MKNKFSVKLFIKKDVVIVNHKPLVVLACTVSNQTVKKKHKKNTSHSRHWCRWRTDIRKNKKSLIQYFILYRRGGVEDKGRLRLEKGNHCLWWHFSVSAVYNASLKLLSVHNPLCGNLILYALSVRLLQPYIQGRIIVFLNMQTSRSIVDAPWAEMMCKIAFFLEACRPGRGGIMKQTHHKLHWQIV